jgi:hypothetical protein
VSVRRPKNYENSRYEVPAYAMQDRIFYDLLADENFGGCPE